jgi:uncharacterized protein (DUF1330 family)
MSKILGSLALVAALSFLPAFAARADVWMLEVLSLQPGVSPHHVETYIGALDLVARRHGGVRVSRYQAGTIEEGKPRLVGLWRFPTPDAMAALMDDPAYAWILKLRENTFDTPSSSTLALMRQ